MPSSDDAGGELALAVDIGGTKMAAALIDRAGVVRWAARVPTPAASDAEEVWAVLAGMLDGVPGQAVVCGVGCGGPMRDGNRLVSPLNIAGWRDFPLQARLAAHTGLATFVDNDAKALALGEGWLGAAVGARNYLSMVVSTGVGAGIVLDGRLLEGREGNAGHIGHVTVVPGGRRCACGSRGCLEAEASGTAIAARTGALPQAASPEVVARTGRLVGQAVASVANLLDLDLATVAGSVAFGFGAPFFAAAQHEARSRAQMPYSSRTRIIPSALGPEAPLVGAAAVGWRGLGRLGAGGPAGEASTGGPAGEASAGGPAAGEWPGPGSAGPGLA